MTTLLAVKLKNLLPAEYHCKLRNIAVNGDKRGCTGFIQYNGKTVYVYTEPVIGLGMMARLAKNDQDHVGGHNHFVDTPEALVALIAKLFQSCK